MILSPVAATLGRGPETISPLSASMTRAESSVPIFTIR